MKHRQSLVIGSRKSRLALWQTNAVKLALAALGEQLEIVVREFSTRGDENISQPLPEIGGKGLFTAELDAAILDSRIDIAVHSLKDLPTTVDDGLKTISVLKREDSRDVLVTKSNCELESLHSGAIVGTSSNRRQAQILALRPDLECRPIRGNVPTRIKKVRDGEYDATVLAAAGLIRLGLESEISQWFDSSLFLPAPGQAMIAATCRDNDDFSIRLLECIQHKPDDRCVTAERGVLARLGGGCSAPIGAIASPTAEGQLSLSVRVGLTDGSSHQEVEVWGSDPEHAAAQASESLKQRGAWTYLNGKDSLAGNRIVVTRGEDQSKELRQLIRHAGAVDLSMPTIAVAEKTGVSLPDLNEVDWLLFTSKNAVKIFADMLERNSVELPSSLQIACVGTGTATAASMQGWTADFVPQSASGDSLAKELAADLSRISDLQPQRFLFPSAAVVRSKMVQILESNGHHVAQLPIYETAKIDLTEQAIEQLRAGVDAVTFASPSAVTSFCTQLKDQGLLKSVVADTVFACVGNTTAAALESLCPGAKIATGKYPSMAALIGCLEEHCSGQNI